MPAVFDFAGPSSVPTSEVLLQRCSSRHPYPQPHPGSIPTTGGDMRPLVARLPFKEYTHLWVTREVVIDACSDSTNAGHHFPCFSECTSPPVSRLPQRPSINPPTWTFWRWRLWSELPQARKEAGIPTIQHLDLTVEYSVTKAFWPYSRILCDQSILTLQ